MTWLWRQKPVVCVKMTGLLRNMYFTVTWARFCHVTKIFILGDKKGPWSSVLLYSFINISELIYLWKTKNALVNYSFGYFYCLIVAKKCGMDTLIFCSCVPIILKVWFLRRRYHLFNDKDNVNKEKGAKYSLILHLSVNIKGKIYLDDITLFDTNE